MACNFRIGHGYDAHRFAQGRDLILGGTKVEYEYGLMGHSDADVMVHALMDSLLGAAALGDIGLHFPDNDGSFKDISSMILLERVYSLLHEKGYTVVNCDITVIAQKPKLRPYIEQMRDNVAKALNVKVDRINIKATTEEKMGFTGRLEGISSHAVSIIEKEYEDKVNE